MKTRYFNTKEAAERHLEIRRKAAYKRIEKRGDRVYSDKSTVYQGCGKCKNFLCLCSNYIPKWFARLDIYSEQFIKDLTNIKSLEDIRKEEPEIINELSKTISKNIATEALKNGMNKPNFQY